jgi:hypothetical protein
MSYTFSVQPHQVCSHAPESGCPRRFQCDTEADLATVLVERAPLNPGDRAFAAAEGTSWITKDGTTWTSFGGGMTPAQVALRVLLRI